MSAYDTGQSVSFLHHQEICAADYRYCFVVDKEWCVTGQAPPVIDDDLIGFVNTQGQVVGFTPVH